MSEEADVEAALEAVDVRTRRTRPSEFGDVIAAEVEEPAVGVALDSLDVSLAETPVTVDPTPAELRDATTGVTPAAFCIADYGSLVLPNTADGAELVSLFVERHVAVLPADAAVPDMETAFERFGEEIGAERDSAVLATGPSATADMGELVQGAHGPREVVAILLTR